MLVDYEPQSKDYPTLEQEREFREKLANLKTTLCEKGDLGDNPYLKIKKFLKILYPNFGNTQNGARGRPKNYLTTVQWNYFFKFIEDRLNEIGPVELVIFIEEKIKGENVMDSNYKFQNEAELQDLMIANLTRIPIQGKTTKLFPNGKEFQTNAGPIDILAFNDENTFYVIDTKFNRGKDIGIAQIMRYMGALKLSLPDASKVFGVLVAPGFDQNTVYAASVVSNIILLDSRTAVLPFCVKTIDIGGRQVPVYSHKIGLLDVSIAAEFDKSEEDCKTEISFKGRTITASNLSGRQNLIKLFLYIAYALEQKNIENSMEILDSISTPIYLNNEDAKVSFDIEF